MCKHFAHKVEVRYDTEQGQVDFPMGQADLIAHQDRLDFEVRAENDEGLEQAKFILEDHIVRFAFREKLERLNWSD